VVTARWPVRTVSLSAAMRMTFRFSINIESVPPPGHPGGAFYTFVKYLHTFTGGLYVYGILVMIPIITFPVCPPSTISKNSLLPNDLERIYL
jgi:hypothetical protein